MRFMMIVKGDRNYEAGMPPDGRLIEAVGKLNQEMARTGAMIAAGGLLPSAAGARIRADGGTLSITDGPFAEAKEVIGGFAILKAGSKAEALEMGRAFMQLHVDILGPSYEGELEIRQMYEEGEECR